MPTRKQQKQSTHGRSHGKARGRNVPARLTGKIRVTARGFGYVETDAAAEDIEIAPEHLNTALDRDTVEIALLPRTYRGRLRGEVITVATRSRTRFIGTLETENGLLFVRPDDRRVYVDFIAETPAPPDVRPGEKVAVELVRWTSMKKNPLVRIIEQLGPAGEHETEMRSILSAQGFDWRFPEEVMSEAAGIEADKTEFFDRERARRRDMRGTPTFTIDPDDAKDFDDAISVRELDNGLIELGVHIADVSAYLHEGTSMDKEAQKRGTSVYLVDRTIPMLPEALSNDLCSLVPHEERLAMSAIFTMSTDGTVHERWFGETIIRSDRRYTYRDAQTTLDTHTGDLAREIAIAANIAHALRSARFANGSIAFDTDEVKFELDSSGKPVRAYRKEHLETNLMIEDLMLLANREVATWAYEDSKKNKNAPSVFVWRIHDTPKPERIEELSLYLAALGYDLPHKRGMVTAQAINALFREIEGSPEQDLIETAAIRAMAKAIYSVKNIGHFGLAFDFYTHFTSPIRRYPDVMVHRLVKKMLAGVPLRSNDFAWHERLCAQCTDREIAAMEAERDSVKLKQVEFLSTHIGDEFAGVVTGINDWGIFVQEVDSMAEGLIRTNTLRDDMYELRDHGFRLVGVRTGRSFSLGDKVRVRLKGTDIEQKTIDWELIDRV